MALIIHDKYVGYNICDVLYMINIHMMYMYTSICIYITEALLPEYVCRSFEIPNLWSIFTLYHFLPKYKNERVTLQLGILQNIQHSLST